MSGIDWLVLGAAMVGILIYGIYKGKGSRSMKAYFASDDSVKWYTIGLSIMATQASAITFLSAPGQAYSDGMRFIQIYLGLPIAMIIISKIIIPIYKKQKILTAYEYLGNRFNNNTRLLGAFLFLIQRGLAAGFTIYAPALVISSVLGWDINILNLVIGVFVIGYTVLGGTKAVAHTHKLQMLVILSGMLLAGILVIWKLPSHVGFTDVMDISGQMNRLNIIDWHFDPKEKYTIWSGLIGGLFLALSYFGTDQSQVQRYLGDQPSKQSQIGLLFNGFVKIPMQFFIMLIGILVFGFYQFQQPPISFNEADYKLALSEGNKDSLLYISAEYDQINAHKESALSNYLNFKETGETAAAEQSILTAKRYQISADSLKKVSQGLIKRSSIDAQESDINYIFLHFVLSEFPIGVIGLLLACILFASMSSTASELNALASTTMVDFYKHQFKKDGSEKHYFFMSKAFTAFWGVYAIIFSFIAGQMDSLIEAVNVLGSLFYGTILGIFLVGFFIKKITGRVVFIAAMISEILIIGIYFSDTVAYLWLTFIGALLVIGLSLVLSAILPPEKEKQTH